jgi:hypothetical protein
MSKHASGDTENNTNMVIGSSLSNSPVIAGPHAQASVSVNASQQDQELMNTIAELRQGLDEARAAIDRRDDETRESLELASSRLTALEEELHTDRPKWERVTKLMTGIRDAVKGLTSLTVSADALWNAIEKVIR